jgi:hypothetical protein
MSFKQKYSVDYDSDSDSEYDRLDLDANRKNHGSTSENRMNENIKIIPKLGHQAGLNKCDFDTSLDKNAENW